MAITDEQFRQAIRGYLEAESMTISQLAEKIGKGRSTVSDWVNLGVKRDEVRQQIVDEYPFIFKVDGSEAVSAKEPSTTRSSNADHALLVLVRTEQARIGVHTLMEMLLWFLFAASVEDRNRFRDSLGRDWKNFLELTRAMTNEHALGVTLQEGRLDWSMKRQTPGE